MKIVIQCAATKDSSAGCMRTSDGRRVLFVADPGTAPASSEFAYARPDDTSEDGRTWRDRLVRYNDAPGSNPYGLLQAYRLYGNPVYKDLAQGVGTENLFILSAGWGLIPSTFLTPAYDITFSGSAEKWKHRGQREVYADFRLAEQGGSEPLVFLGGKDYLPLFARLTNGYAGRRVAFFNLQVKPEVDGIEFVRYPTPTRTNWHYESAKALLDGRLQVPGA